MLLLRLLRLSSSMKRTLKFTVDVSLVIICLAAAHMLRYGTLNPEIAFQDSWALFPTTILLGGILIGLFKLPDAGVHALGSPLILRIAIVAAGLSMSSILVSYMLGLSGPSTVPLIFGALFFLAAVTVRVLFLQLLTFLRLRSLDVLPVAIYGAGAGGIQMALALNQSIETHPVFFIDDNPNLHGLMIAGLPVYSPNKLPMLVKKHNIGRVLLAIPSIPKNRRDQLVSQLSEEGVDVQVLPSYVDLMAGKGLNASPRPVSPDQLLARDNVDLDTPEVGKAYAGRVVMVSGAGGSIGAELCRQLLHCKPAALVLFERNEFALYSIDQELRRAGLDLKVKIVSRIGSVTDSARVAGVVAEEGVDIILHAAAYKHVPLVEENELEGARNNVLGTKVLADIADEYGLERFILVSTDKAVRPTNIMGATKRMAELVIQDKQTRCKKTKFSMVRFGNVLGSSGSVIPLFQKQIETGGPVTVTHPDVTRFFMTIPEAARLVLLAGAYAEGGDVFVLDMGKPQKIINVARKLIELSGRKVKDPATGQGDIAIEITGLRPGEKLYEELLIDRHNLRTTPHPKILRAKEDTLSQTEIAMMIRDIESCITHSDPLRLRKIVQERVDGYHLQHAIPAQ
ncbi:nucleoside-diphosphate sugar epimerase/dehydratase [Aquicoccus sp. G2-2]|uniref:polysaccharide biosynthesis protein n=1 Tax=Aquicoccus sp. G2-2 TaxID=3092120 RepID=UPI002ADFAAB4|nr:nucleoside-diphosphate sugar epimerase/dehydratase [Aquicoccus sp. G2-2]MEA1115085.1 nucleoside-diphosphate sugar epimerase/dehydratase [Aquicoccus sp. G2-2]